MLTKIRVQDIASLTDFHRNSTAHCKRLRLSGRPQVLTVNGKAVLVVQDAAAYQKLLESVDAHRLIHEGQAELRTTDSDTRIALASGRPVKHRVLARSASSTREK